MCNSHKETMRVKPVNQRDQYAKTDKVPRVSDSLISDDNTEQLCQLWTLISRLPVA